MSDDAVTSSAGGEEPRAVRARRAPAPGGGFALRTYKPGQGYYTRVGTAVGIGVLTVCGAVFLHGELDGIDLEPKTLLAVQYGVTAGFIVVLALVTYWLVGLSRKVNDFFIATEGEMKKVSWSSRKEVVRSTKVVIVTVVLMGVFLFAADVFFMLLMRGIGVLEGGPGVLKLIGLE